MLFGFIGLTIIFYRLGTFFLLTSRAPDSEDHEKKNDESANSFLCQRVNPTTPVYMLYSMDIRLTMLK